MLSGALALLASVSLAVWSFQFKPDSSPLFTVAGQQAPKSVGEKSDGSPVVQTIDPQIDEALARPIFDPKRRPSAENSEQMTEAIVPAGSPVADDPVAEPNMQQDLRLLGVQLSVLSSSALIDQGGETGSRWFSKGERVGNYAIADIDAGSVRLVCPDRSEPDCEKVLFLYENRAGG